jgi:hypothetical protein
MQTDGPGVPFYEYESCLHGIYDDNDRLTVMITR